MGTDRRGFLKVIFGVGGIGSLAAILYPVLTYLIPPKIAEPKVNFLKVGSASEFPAESYKIIKFGRVPIILVKRSSGEFAALSATCTHLDCIVQYKKDTKQIWCACHNGIYDLKGRNVSGPPPRPLTEYKASVVEDEIIITSQTA